MHVYMHDTTTATTTTIYIYIDMWIGKMIQFSISDESRKIGSILNLWNNSSTHTYTQSF